MHETAENILNNGVKRTGPIIGCLAYDAAERCNSAELDLESNSYNSMPEAFKELTLRNTPTVDRDIYHVDWDEQRRQTDRTASIEDPDPPFMVDERDKESPGLYPCISVIVVGFDPNLGKNISLMTHDRPDDIRGETHFQNDLKQSLDHMKERCEPGSFSVIFSGGNYPYSKPTETSESDYFDYVKTMQVLNNIVQDSLDLSEPISIIAGPKQKLYGVDDFYFQTQTRRLFFHRPDNCDNRPLTIDQLEQRKDVWNNWNTNS